MVDLLLVKPERIESSDIIDAEVMIRIVPFDVIEPAVINALPGHGEERRVLFHHGLRLPDELLARRPIELAINALEQGLEVGIGPRE